MTKYWRFKEPLKEPNVYASTGDAIFLHIPGGKNSWIPREALEEVPAPIPVSEEPPRGTVILDEEGDAWQRTGDHWYCAMGGSGEGVHWDDLQALQPFIPLIREPTIEELEFWFQRIALGSGDAAQSLLAYLKRDR